MKPPQLFKPEDFPLLCTCLVITEHSQCEARQRLCAVEAQGIFEKWYATSGGAFCNVCDDREEKEGKEVGLTEHQQSANARFIAAIRNAAKELIAGHKELQESEKHLLDLNEGRLKEITAIESKLAKAKEALEAINCEVGTSTKAWLIASEILKEIK